MNELPNLPKKVLTAIFQYLSRPDLLCSSYSCWQWNSVANSYLYHEVCCSEEMRLEQLLRTITPILTSSTDNASEAMTRQKQLGRLIQIVKVHPDWSGSNASPWYLPLLMKLSAVTPNVHSANLINPATRLTTTLAKSNKALQSGLWETLACNWPQWRSLTMEGLTGWSRVKSITNANALENLQHLDVMYCTGHLSCLLPLYAMPNLESLKVEVNLTDGQNYERAKAMVEACGRSLKILVLMTDGAPFSREVNLDGLIEAAPNLKSLAIASNSDLTQFTVSRFGTKLEELEIIGKEISYHKAEEHEGLLQDRMKTCKNLKTLSIGSCFRYKMFLPPVIANNISTLQNLYIAGPNSEYIIKRLTLDNIVAPKVTALCIEDSVNMRSLELLAQIFPNVQYLALTQPKWNTNDKWVPIRCLSQVKHLIGIDTTLANILEEQSSRVYQIYEMRRPLFFKSALFSQHYNM